MKTVSFSFLVVVLLAVGCRPNDEATMSDEALRAQAEAMAEAHIIVDGHIDIPYRLDEYAEDISEETVGGDFDYPRVKAGGLDAPFMSIYIPASYQETGGAKAYADSLIDMVEGFEAAHPDKFAVATSVADVRRHHEQDLVSLPMGMENGAPIEDNLANLAYFHERGIRYITLTHSRDNLIGDSSYDTTRTWNGLSDFGRDVVPEMNRLGIMIDISHVSDSTFYDVLELTKAPVIASHSSMRAYTPDWERNMSDDMVRALAENGGVIMINFGSSFLKMEYQAAGTQIQRRIVGYLNRNGIERDSPEGYAYFAEQRRQNPVGTIDDVILHIEHVIDLVGIDHVGLGSDFDGVFALPEGLQDVSEYPNLIAELLKRGYAEEDIRKILGENLLRVWAEVERVAAGS